MHPRLRNRENIVQFLVAPMFFLVLAGLCGVCPAPALASGGGEAGSAVGWVVGESYENYGLILHTVDGGANWVRQGSSAELPDAGLLGVSAVDRDCAWAVGANVGGYGVILRTTDGGAHWVRQGTAETIPDIGLFDVYAVSRSVAWVTGADGLILHTIDGGNTWVRQGESVTPAVLLTGVYARDTLNVWAIGLQSGSCGVIVHSTDGGASWRRQTYTPRSGILGPNLLCTHGNRPHTVWVVGNGTVMRSPDDGATWEDMTPESTLYDFNGVFAVDAANVWITRDQGGVFKFDGSQWQMQQTGAGAYEVMRIAALDGETAWAVGGAVEPDVPPGIILFKGEGQNWTVQHSEQVHLVAVSFCRALGGRTSPAVYEPLLMD